MILKRLAFFFCMTVVPIWAADIPAETKNSGVYSGENSLKPVLQLITRAKEKFQAEVFLMNDSRVLEALEDAAERGVKVRLILESSNKSNRRSAAGLKHKNIEVRWFKRTGKGSKKSRLHARSACVDDKRLMVGSVDWTPKSLSRDRETLVVLEQKALCRQWQLEFDELWDEATKSLPKRYALQDELESLPDPKQYTVTDPKAKLDMK